MWRRAPWLLLLLALNGVAGAQSSPPAAPQISLLTFQPGEVYWQRYGHNALRVVEARGEAVYNYGIFDFGQKNFALNFARGRMQYRLATEPFDYTLAVYAEQGRWVNEQVLDFSPEQARRVARFLAHNALPENAEYRYDYFTANCSTQVRDVINLGSDGALESALTPVMTPATYRSDAARMMAPLPPMMWLTDVLLGPSTDRPITLWQRSFLPEVLMDGVRQVRLADGRPLVRSEQMRVPGDTSGGVDSAPKLVMPFAVSGLTGAGALLLLAGWGAQTGRGGATAAARLAWTFAFLAVLVSGLVGWVLLLGWTLTDHEVMHGNLSLMAFSPASLLLVPMLIVCACRRAPLRTLGVGLLVLPVATTLVALLGQLLPAAQQHLHWLLFWLPLHLAVLVVLTTLRRPR